MIKSFCKGLIGYQFLLKTLIKREITVKYRRSVLGILWSVLNPLLTMMVITTVFSVIMRIDIPNYPVYYLTGYVMWSFMSEATMASMTSIYNNSALIKKVYLPKYIFPLEKSLFGLVNFAFSMIAVVIMFVVFQVTPSFTMLLFFVPVIYCYIFTLGMSLLLSALAVQFRDIQHLYSVVLTMWMYLTPIIYDVERIEEISSSLAFVLKLNPMYYYVTYFREVLLYGIVPGLYYNLACIASSLIVLLFGVWVFKSRQSKFVLYM